MDLLPRYMRCLVLLAFLLGSIGWSGTVGNKVPQARAGCALPQSCYGWAKWGGCNMGSTPQTNPYSIIDECTTNVLDPWSRAYRHFEYQFDLVHNYEDGDGEAEPGGIIAVSGCNKKTGGPADRPDAVAVIRSGGFVAGTCHPVRVTFWFRLSHNPVFSADPAQEYNLKVFVEEYRQLLIPNEMIWGNQSDYTDVVPNEWHHAEAVFGRDTGVFYINFFAYHNDNCQTNIKTIAVDSIAIEQPVPSAVCNTTTAGTTSSTVATTTSTENKTTEPTTVTDPVTIADSTTANGTTASETTAITTIRSTAFTTYTISTVFSVTSTDTSGRTLASETTQSMPFVTLTIHTLPTTESGTEAVLQARLSDALKNATDLGAYLDNYTYIAQAPSNVLAAVENLMHNITSVIDFANIQNLANFFLQFTEMEVPPELLQDWKNRTTTVLAIAGEILKADQAGTLTPPSNSEESHHVASAIYQSLENLFNNLPPAEDAYVFSTSFSVAYVHVLLVNSSSKFEDFRLRTNLQVRNFERGVLTPGDSNSSTDFLARIELSQGALRRSFEELQRNSNGSTRFVFSLSAMPSFGFATYSPSSSSLERPSPLLMLASVGQRIPGQDIVSIQHNVDKLFNYPFGARRQHQCTFLNYTSKQWSDEGCRVRSKTPSWNGTIVECSCDHLTPFLLLLTLCSSVLGQALPDGSPYSLDLAVITTVTAMVSVTCCLLALVITIIRSWKNTIIFDEDAFARTALWIVLFGTYLTVLFQQSMVFAPDFCGERFCLATAILVHWFSLMSVAWTAVQAVRLVQMVQYPEVYARKDVVRGDDYDGFRMRVWIGSTFIPMIFPLIASVSHFTEETSAFFHGLGYASHEKWCWLDADHPWISWVTFVVPLSMVALLNVSAVIFYFHTMRLRRKQRLTPDKYNSAHIKRTAERLSSSESTAIRTQFYGVIVTTGLMGLIWLSAWLLLFSCFVDPTVQHIFVLLLTVACGSQGVYFLYFQAVAPKKKSTGRQRLKRAHTSEATLSGPCVD